MGKAHDVKLCAFLKKGYYSEILETLLIFSPFLVKMKIEL
ncbi:hypothetical protein KN10_0484 [Anoxybacillus flavithermus NBRC 109594]|uniref:Uncharacterized protein n=1 Tax=Anoxybacillus flavithermus NBRC 109594 TaxID=1315967 RepID=R4FZE1_9BACL|nr:hypothetical protein KN10_0484 [Anoxybacillus flavithermus NBRC 109594]